MPMEADDLDDMKALVQVARKREVNFAICMGKKPEGTIFFMHRKKDPTILARNAKKAGESAKLASGTCTVKGKKILLTCIEDPPPAMARQMKLFLKDNDLPFKVSVLDQNGEEIDSDGEDDVAEDGQFAMDDFGTEEQGDPGRQDQPEVPVDELQKKWEAVVGPLGALYRMAMETDPPNRTQLEAAWAMATERAGGGDYKSGLKIAAKLKPNLLAIAEADDQSEPETDEARQWARIEPGLQELYTKAMQGNPPDATKLSAAWAMATEKADAGDHVAALKIADRLRPLLEAGAMDGAPSGAKDEIPTNVVAFQKSRILWINTRKAMFAEMKKLEDAISAHCSADPDLAEVASQVGELTKRLDAFDERLEDVLDEITNTAEGPERLALKKQALEAISAYRNALADEFFKDVDAGNGFTNVSVAAAANKSLDSIAKAIA